MQFSAVNPNAKIAANVEIGPFSYIAENVEIGEGCVIGPHVTILDYVKIGKNCKIFPGAVIGAVPQDMKFSGEVSWVEIGDNTVIRECATVNRGTAASGKLLTKIGDNCLKMTYALVAHDCHIGTHVFQPSYVGQAGATEIDDWSIIGGGSLAHQFTRVGMHAMIQGGSLIGKDVPPYALAGRNPLSFCGLNNVGLRRRGFTNEQIDRIREIYRIIYNSGLNRSDACVEVEREVPPCIERDNILNFIRASKRGIVKFSDLSADE